MAAAAIGAGKAHGAHAEGKILMSNPTYLYCVARGRDHQWQAFCLDFDLAVQGRSFDEVAKLLETAVLEYVRSAMNEPEPARSQLLHRRVPLLTRLVWSWRVAMWTLMGKREAEESTIGFPVPCPA